MKDDFLSWVIVGSTLIGTVALTLVLVRYSMGRLKKQLAGLQNALGGQIEGGLMTGVYLRLHDVDVETRVTLTPAGKNTPPRLTLQKMRILPFTLYLGKENFATRGLARWGLMKDVQVGEPAFDGKYTIRSSDPLRAQSYFQDEKNRARIDRYFDSGFDWFRVDKHSASVSKPNYKPEDLAPARISEYLAILSELVG